MDLSIATGRRTRTWRVGLGNVMLLADGLPDLPMHGSTTMPSRVLRAGLGDLLIDGELLAFRHVAAPVRGMTPTASSGTLAGLRINGTIHQIESRVGVCRLTPIRVDGDGLGVLGDPVDVRERRQIETDNMGVIGIRRTRSRSRLIHEVLDHLGDDAEDATLTFIE